jgi:hypothetical protein
VPLPGSPSKTPPTGRPALPEPESDERRTVVPDFDPAAFARDSEIKQRAASAVRQEPTLARARQLHSVGQYEEALFALGQLLELAPLQAEATKLSVECREALERECLSSVGSASAILVLAVTPEELKTFALDSVSGFLLSLMDGGTDVQTLLDICGLPRLVALRRLRGMIEHGILVVASRVQPRS